MREEKEERIKGEEGKGRRNKRGNRKRRRKKRERRRTKTEQKKKQIEEENRIDRIFQSSLSHEFPRLFNFFIPFAHNHFATKTKLSKPSAAAFYLY